MTIPNPIIPEAPMANAIDDVKLMDCPFCGATPHRGPTKMQNDQLHGEPFQRYRVWCPKGHASFTEMTEGLAYAAWNTRSPAPSQHTGWSDEAVEALREIAEMTDPDSPDSYRADDREGCLDTVNATARAAVTAASSIAPATGFEVVTIDVLQAAHIARQEDWCPDQKPDLSFRGNEMAGEVGEACNVIKKLERERHGWRGSRDTIDHLGEELADVVHTAILCAITAGIDLGPAVVAKFNATSIKNDLPKHVIGISPSVAKESGEP